MKNTSTSTLTTQENYDIQLHSLLCTLDHIKLKYMRREPYRYYYPDKTDLPIDTQGHDLMFKHMKMTMKEIAEYEQILMNGTEGYNNEVVRKHIDMCPDLQDWKLHHHKMHDLAEAGLIKLAI